MMIDEKYTKYAKDVIDGVEVAGEYVKRACKNYLDWFKREDIEFRCDKADKVINFCKNVTNGKNPQLNITFQDWQIFILYAIFGWYWKGTEERVIHNVYIEVARKNGKSTLISLIALYMMMGDGEYRSEVDIVANSHKQAKLLYKMSSDYCESIDPKGKYFKRYRDNIQFTKSKSQIQVLASDTKSLDGYNSYMFCQDEVHEAPDDTLYNVMKTSQASRVNPLAILITTAGLDMNSFCYKFRQNCIDILFGLKQDDSQFTMIYSLDEGDDYRDESVWKKANPNIDVSVRRSYLKEQVLSSENNTSLTANIMTKNFNVWSQTFDVWIDNDMLVKNSQPLKPEDFIGKQVWIGVDLAAVSDLTAVTMLSVEDGKYRFYTKYYVPSSVLSHNYNQERYKEYKNNGYLTVCPGNVTDYDYILRDLLKWREMGILIDKIGYDSWNSTSWATHATEEGLPLEPYSQTLGSFNRPTKEFERLIKQGSVILANNPITRWCFANVALKVDYNDNAKPVKAGSDNDKIDGVISIIEALGTYLTTPLYTAMI